MIRKVYMVEAVTTQGDLRFRRYFRNKKLAEKVCRKTVREDAQFDGIKAQDVTGVYWDGYIKDEWVERK